MARPVLLLPVLGLAACGVTASEPEPSPGAASPSSAATPPAAGPGGTAGAGFASGRGGAAGIGAPLGGSGTGGWGAAPSVPPGASGTSPPDASVRGGAGGPAGSGGASGTPGPGGAAGAPTDAAPPAASGAGVTIAGTVVPRDRAIVFLHIGHSNMAGRASSPEALRPFFYETNKQLWIYQKGGTFRPAKEPTAPDSGTGSMAGPGMALLKTALALAPDRTFISIGMGRSGTQGGTCTSWKRGGLFWDTYLAPARELKGKVTFGAIFTMLGITENRFDAATNMGFSDCMKAVAADIRADLGEPELPFIVGDFERNQTNARITPEFIKLITDQLAMVPTKVTRSALIPTDGLPIQDEHHYNLQGHKIWAERGLGLLRQKGWAPWAP